MTKINIILWALTLISCGCGSSEVIKLQSGMTLSASELQGWRPYSNSGIFLDCTHAPSRSGCDYSFYDRQSKQIYSVVNRSLDISLPAPILMSKDLKSKVLYHVSGQVKDGRLVLETIVRAGEAVSMVPYGSAFESVGQIQNCYINSRSGHKCDGQFKSITRQTLLVINGQESWPLPYGFARAKSSDELYRVKGISDGKFLVITSMSVF